MDWKAFGVAVLAVLVAMFFWDLFVAALVGEKKG